MFKTVLIKIDGTARKLNGQNTSLRQAQAAAGVAFSMLTEFGNSGAIIVWDCKRNCSVDVQTFGRYRLASMADILSSLCTLTNLCLGAK